MENTTAPVSIIQRQDDVADTPFSAGQMSDDEARAAGWLSEALSAQDNASAIGPATPEKSSNGFSTLGDAILKGMNRVSSNYMKTAGEMHSAMESTTSGSPGIMGVLSMHMSFIEVSLQADVASKCISKSEQTVEQLVKQQ